MNESKDVVRQRARALVRSERALLSDLVEIRKAHNLTQAVVAERMGVSQSAVAQMERYDANPTLSTLTRYALAVGARMEHRVIDDVDGYVESRDANVIPFRRTPASRLKAFDWGSVKAAHG